MLPEMLPEGRSAGRVLFNRSTAPLAEYTEANLIGGSFTSGERVRVGGIWSLHFFNRPAQNLSGPILHP